MKFKNNTTVFFENFDIDTQSQQAFSFALESPAQLSYIDQLQYDQAAVAMIDIFATYDIEHMSRPLEDYTTTFDRGTNLYMLEIANDGTVDDVIQKFKMILV